MGKKRNLQIAVTEEELDYINDKKSMNFEYVDDFKKNLKFMTSMKIDIKCKNEKQKEFLNALKNPKNELCIGMGAAGTGKSFISLAYALKEIKEGNFKNIVIVIPTIQAGGNEGGLGFLKGTYEDKVQPFMDCDIQTITKILNMSGNYNAGGIATSLMSSGIIKYELINFMLGKTFDDSLILINEAEQYTVPNMRLLLTRIGENSKMIITGDAKQVNRVSIANKKEVCGLSFISDRLDDLEEVSTTVFSKEDIVRNKLITKILDRID